MEKEVKTKRVRNEKVERMDGVEEAVFVLETQILHPRSLCGLIALLITSIIMFIFTVTVFKKHKHQHFLFFNMLILHLFFTFTV